MALKEAIEAWLRSNDATAAEKAASASSPTEDPDPEMPSGRLLIDGRATREAVFNAVRQAVEKRFPVENDNYRIELRDIKYEGPMNYTLAQQKQAILHNRKLGCSLAGTWRLIDKKSGKILDERRDSVLRVPYYTNRGTIINNGSEYTVISQARLSPGVYTRKKQNGELEAQFNVANGKGFRLELDRETGKINLRMGQANLPLYPVLRAFGVSDQQLAKSWGSDVALSNASKNDTRAIQKLYEKLAGYKYDPLMTPQNQITYIKDELEKFGLDPATVVRTLGIENVQGVTPEVLLRASQKLLNVNRGVEEPDNRDNPRFSKFYGIEHMLGERIDKDSAKLLKPMLFRVGRDKSLARVGRNALGAYIDDFLSTSGLAQPGEEANPMSILVQQSRITRTGEGGISSPDLITPEARGVQGDYLGFVDFLAGPECMPKGCEVFTRSGWIKWEEASEDTEFACLIDGILEFHKPFKLHVHDYDGDLYCAAAKLISYRYTPNHKMYVNPCFHLKDGSLTKYRFEYAVDVSKKGRHVMTGGHGAFKGSEMPYFTLPEVAIGAPNQTRIKDIPIEDWAEFMGWYLSEGNTYIRKGKRPKDVHYSVIITQEKYFDALMQCVQRLPFRFNTKSHNGNPNGGIVISCKQLALYLSQFGKSADKFIPEYFFDAPVAVRKRLLYGLMMGDGRKKRDTWTYMTVSKRLARDVERLGFGLGYSVHLRFERDDRPQANYGGTYAVHFCKKNERELKKKDRWSSGNYYTEHYSGKVYCATVPGHLLFVRSDSSTMGHWTGNSSAAGVDVRGSYGTVIGSDHKLYNIFRNLRTGKKEYLSLDAAADKVIAFPDQDPKSPYMYCMRNGVPTRVKTSEVDYMVPSFSRTLGAGINMNPMPTAVFGMRSFYSSKFWEQYLPQKKGEVPMVDSLMPDGKMTFNEYYGRKAGCITAPFSGVVARVTNDSIVIKGKDGKTESFDLVTNLPHNRMSVTGDTEVFVKRNHKVFKIRIEDYSHNDGDEVLSYNPDTMSSAWMRITGFTRHDNIRKLLRVTYKSGRFIDVTEDHSLITLSDDFRFIPIYPKDCRPGVTKTPLVHGNINTDNRWTYDMGVLDGLYLSEGYVGMNSRREPAVCNIACLPLKRRQYIASILASLGYKVQPKSLTTTRERHSKIFGREVNGNSGTVSWTDHDLACRWLRDFGSHANLKRISSEVYGRGKDYLHGLLSGYLAGDGGLWKDSNNAAQIEASTSSRQLRDDLVSLCTLLGIMVTVSGGKKNGEGCLPLFSMRISTVYAEVLTPLFAYPDRQKKLEGILEMTACSSRKSMWYEQIPVDTKPAKKHLYACSGKPVDNFVYKSTSRGFVAKKRISTYSGRPGQLGRSDILWDKIISIQEIPHQDHVYDFSVDKAEAFAVANGLLVHNTQFSLMATVKPGMEVKEGDILAHSNFTDPKTGAFNMGQNLKVAILPGPRNANSFEDALIFSEEAAKRLATSRLYNFDQDSKNGVSVNKNKYIAAFPSAFTKDQIETIDDNGVVKVGTELHRGDPIILATGPKVLSAENAQLGKLSSVLKNAITDKAQTWNHDWPGTVTDIVTGASGAKVLIKSEPPLKVGDKASGRFALKGVTGTILSMDKMPRDAVTNEPYDMLVNPMGFLSRIAPGQLMELALGKVAKKTGQQVRIPQLPPKEGWLNWTRKQLADAGVSETADVFDPQTGRTLKGIGDGYMYVQAMHHLAEKKYSARGLEGGYTQDQQPAKGGETGAKKMCFTADQVVRVLHGEEKIGHICEKRIPAYVWTRFDDGSWGYSIVTNWFVRNGKMSEVLDIIVDGLPGFDRSGQKKVVYVYKALHVTKQHHVFSPDRGEILAGDLRPGDWLTSYGYVPTDDQMSLLMGSMLGDGCICNVNDNIRKQENGRLVGSLPFYQEQHSHHQYDYVNWKIQSLGTLVSSRKNTQGKSRSGFRRKDGTDTRVAYYQVHRHDIAETLKNMFYRQPDGTLGRKNLSSVDLDRINDAGIAAFFLDDGYVTEHVKDGRKTGSPTGGISTLGFTEEENEKLAVWLSGRLEADVHVGKCHTRVGSEVRYYSNLYLSADACRKMARLVAKYVPLKAIPKTKKWLIGEVSHLQDLYVGIDTHYALGSVPVLVTSVKPYDDGRHGPDDDVCLYDMTVEKSHKYCASDCLVSNSGFDQNALLSHGATEVLRDAMTVRGTSNEEYWRKLRLGMPIPEPGVPFIYQKFLNNLRAGGINVVEKGDTTSILPQTDQDIEKLAEGRVIDSSQMVDADFDPVKGGLFDLSKTGGMGGTRWSMIALPEPVPNPVMEEPVRRVLGLTVKGLSDILSGKETLNGKTGGTAIKEALSSLNVDRTIEQARSDVKSKRGSARDNAVKILGYLTAAKDMNMSPKDWMISKVPVLPPAFRPISKAGDVALIPDTNELYKELLETKHNYEILRQDLPESALTDERLNVYKAVKAAFGLGNSITTEGQAKNLKGPIRQVIGSVPKWGQFQSKVVAKNQDLVGRSVTVPDKNLSMDQVGIPEEMAWTMYKPFVTRGLVQRGYSPVESLKMIEDRTPTARHILDDVMQEKPILMDRAPTWHKFNIMAFKPFIVEGKEIRVCPMIDSGFNMDHDGDDNNGPYVTTFISDKIVENRPLTSEEDLCYNPTIIKPLIVGRSMKKESVVINGQNTPGVVVNLRWDEFPHYDNPTVNRHPNANFYLVPEGVCVRAYDEQKQQLVWAPVKYWSHHGVNEKLEVVTVELSSGRQILTDDDPRGVYGIDPETLTFGRWRPSESVGKFVPRCIKDQDLPTDLTCLDTAAYSDNKLTQTISLDRTSGWFFGAMIGDGWATHSGDKVVNICFCYDKNYNDLGESYKRTVEHTFYKDSEVHFGEIYHDKSLETNRYGNAITIRHSCSDIGLFVSNVIGHGAENKHLPPFWQNAPREFKLGLFEGLLDTDGTLAIVQAKAKKNPQLMCNYSTVSMTLAAEVQYLCRTLGVDSKLTAQKTPAGGRCWQLSISTKNLKSLGLDLKSPHKAKALAEAEIQPDTAAGGRKYMIPVPKNELKRVSSLLLALDRAAYATLNRTGKLGYAPTTIADKIARILKATPELQTDAWKRWLELYENLDSVVWERVEGFTNTGMFEEGFDLTVPGYETFMNAEGIILSNTVNIHVPASDKASKEALEKMLPSKNLFSLTDMTSVRYKPEKEQVSGLWALTSGMTKKPTRRYATKSEAIAAYRQGEIGPNDPVEIG